MLCRVEDLLDVGQRRVCDVDRCFAWEAVSDPAQLEAGKGDDAGGVFEGVAGSVDEVGFDAVHEAASDAVDGPPEQDDDRGGDDDADDRVREGKAEHDADGAQDDGERREPVQTVADPVCDEGSGADFLTDSDALDGDDFVAGEADETGDDNEPQVALTLTP